MAKTRLGKKKAGISRQTLSRRTWISWMGKGCVLSLGGALLASCGDDLGLGVADGPGDGSGTSDGFSFTPGGENHPVFSQWGERTVDRQNLEEILSTWQLQVDGLVETPGTYSFADLLALDRMNQETDFHCVEGWSVNDVPWNGLHLSSLFDLAKPLADASHVTFHTVGGKYNESLPLDVALEAKTLLAYGIAGSTLNLKHGFPLRLVIPRLLAYKNAKYVERIELAAGPEYGYWVKAGYPYEAEVPAERLRPGKY